MVSLHIPDVAEMFLHDLSLLFMTLRDVTGLGAVSLYLADMKEA